MLGLTDGLSYLHQVGVVHGSLKPVRFYLRRSDKLIGFQDNLLIDADGRIYISDFGQARLLNGEEDEHIEYAGCAPFIAPERMPKPPAFGPYSQPTRESDVYAFGLVCYEVRSMWPHFSNAVC